MAASVIEQGDGALPLDPVEESAYRMLVGLSSASAPQLAEVMRVGVAEAEETLHRLAAKGMVSPRGPGDPVFAPLPPEVALATTLLRRQESLDAARTMVTALSEEYRAASRRRDPQFVVEVVTGAGALRETLRSLQDSAQRDILWFCRANPLAMAGTENTEERGALARGVRYQAIYERALIETPGELDSIVEAIGWGEEARLAPSLPVRLAIVDRTTAICPLLPDQARGVEEPTAAVIGPGQLLDALIALFDGHWDRATPLTVDASGAVSAAASARPGEGQGDDIGDGDRALLSLLVAGLGDKSICARLGISTRTVQRRLLRLMAIAGVDSRAALAYQAARRGWI